VAVCGVVSTHIVADAVVAVGATLVTCVVKGGDIDAVIGHGAARYDVVGRGGVLVRREDVAVEEGAGVTGGEDRDKPVAEAIAWVIAADSDADTVVTGGAIPVVRTVRDVGILLEAVVDGVLGILLGAVGVLLDAVVDGVLVILLDAVVGVFDSLD
jgi:hypothetical protein